MPSYEDRVKGMFLGVAIGDALGMPVEMFTPEKIKETYGRVTEYHRPDKHKWFDGHEAGTTTDDTQLTIAVAEGLIECGLDMFGHAAMYVEAFKAGTHGWGRSTKESIRNLSNGTPWNEASIRKGVGNGVAMKIAPLGAYLAAWKSADDEDVGSVFNFAHDLALMTHGTQLAAASALSQTVAVWLSFCSDMRLEDLITAAEKTDPRIVHDSEAENLCDRLVLLRIDEESVEWTDEKIIETFGGGSCYCYDSLPFTYAFYLRHPATIETLYDVVSAGGDTDSNGSMIGAMLGASSGASVFPDHLVDGLKEKDRILDVANRFCEAFPCE